MNIDILDMLKSFGVYAVVIRLFVAILLGGLIGFERGKHGRPAGLRTHILICIGAAMTSLTSLYLVELGFTGDVARLSAQVISGIGFLGAGTILIRNSSIITGLTTAAGMWATAAIGIAVGYGFYVGAFVATVICVFSVTILSRLERKSKDTLNVYIELTNIAEAEQVIDIIMKLKNAIATYDIIPPKSGHAENVGILLTLYGKTNYKELKENVCENSSVAVMVSDINN